MIAQFFQKVLDWLGELFAWLGGLLKDICSWALEAVKAFSSWVAELWQTASLRFLDFVLSMIPDFDLSQYVDTISNIRVVWAEWNNILPLNVALASLILYLDCYLIVVAIKFVKYVFNRLCDIVP